MVLYVFFSIFFIVLKGIFCGFQKMFLFSSVEFLKNLFILLLVLLFFSLGYGLLAPVIAYVIISPLLFLLYSPFALRLSRFFKHQITDFKPMTKKIVLFGIPLFAASFAGRIIGYIDTLILTYFRPLSEVGIYNVILPSALILLYFGRAVTSVAFPMSSELWMKKDKGRLSEGIRLIYKYSFVLIIPVIFVLFAFSRSFISLFFGSEYQSGAVAFQILLIGMMLFIVAMISNNIISAIGHPKTVAKITIISALVNVILNIILIPLFGINGAAISTTISYTLVLILSTLKIKYYVGVSPPVISWVKQTIAAMIFVLVVFSAKSFFNISPWWELIIVAIVSCFVYLITIYILKIVDIKEIKYYWNLLR